jgi:hypothetical protein
MYPERIRDELQSMANFFSGQLLLDLPQRGASREDAIRGERNQAGPIPPKLLPKGMDARPQPGSGESTVLSCILQLWLKSLPLYLWHLTYCFLNRPQLRCRRRKRMRRRNNNRRIPAY